MIWLGIFYVLAFGCEEQACFRVCDPTALMRRARVLRVVVCVQIRAAFHSSACEGRDGALACHQSVDVHGACLPGRREEGDRGDAIRCGSCVRFCLCQTERVGHDASCMSWVRACGCVCGVCFEFLRPLPIPPLYCWICTCAGLLEQGGTKPKRGHEA